MRMIHQLNFYCILYRNGSPKGVGIFGKERMETCIYIHNFTAIGGLEKFTCNLNLYINLAIKITS